MHKQLQRAMGVDIHEIRALFRDLDSNDFGTVPFDEIVDIIVSTNAGGLAVLGDLDLTDSSVSSSLELTEDGEISFDGFVQWLDALAKQGQDIEASTLESKELRVSLGSGDGAPANEARGRRLDAGASGGSGMMQSLSAPSRLAVIGAIFLVWAAISALASRVGPPLDGGTADSNEEARRLPWINRQATVRP